MKSNKRKNIKLYYDQLSEHELQLLNEFANELVERGYKLKDIEVILHDQERNSSGDGL